MKNTEKIVDFHKYCETCKYKNIKEFEDPCNECLDAPTNTNTHKPVYYKEMETKKKKEKK